ncbi:MAG: hypothetical protein ACYTCU_09750, partial [Planctomycetota bacterium]
VTQLLPGSATVPEVTANPQAFSLGIEEYRAVRGNGLAGGAAPVLSGSGSLAPGGNFDIDLAGMPPFTQGPLFVGFIAINAPFKGGVLVPQPFLSIDLPTGFGTLTLGPNTMPPSVPSAFSIYLQAWFPDGGAPQGADATNGLQLLTP